jgi:hypothetical protein
MATYGRNVPNYPTCGHIGPHGRVAQRTEQDPPKIEVAGSTPAAVAAESRRSVVWAPDYEVSSRGRVRNAVSGRTLRPCRNNRGYFQAFLTVGGQLHRPLVSRLVVEAFVGPAAEGMTVDHVNGRPWDNRLENLEYVTQEENNRRAQGNRYADKYGVSR